VVLAGAEGQVWVGVAGDVESVGVEEGVAVAVGCGEQGKSVFASGDRAACRDPDRALLSPGEP
jgi:hypothetical protein